MKEISAIETVVDRPESAWQRAVDRPHWLAEVVHTRGVAAEELADLRSDVGLAGQAQVLKIAVSAGKPRASSLP